MIEQLRSVFEEWNRQQIRYALIRNYEFLLDPQEPPGYDLDIVIAEEDLMKVDALLRAQGFIKYPQQFSLRHVGYGKYFPEISRKVGLDIQVGGIHWNDIPYLHAEQILSRRASHKFFYTLSEEDELVMYICHSLLGKRYFKEKYKRKIGELLMKNTDTTTIPNTLTTIFSQNISKRILTAVQRGDFSVLEKKAYWYAVYYVLKNKRNILPFTRLSFRWLRQKWNTRNYPLISFIGPDGSGKTWNAEQLRSILVENNRKAEVIYTGRGKGNVLPIKRIANQYKEKESTSKPKPFLYTLAAPVYTLDLLLRYFFIVYPKRKKHIVITDRYGSDILLMEHVPLWLKKFLLFFFSKPTLTFYLYNDPDVLYQRRKQQSPEELKRQLELFEYLVKKFNAIPVKTEEREPDLKRIAGNTFEYLMRNKH